jgi:hypothetical protein
MAVHARHSWLDPWRDVGAKDISSSLLHDLVHQLNQVRLLISLLIHFSEILDGIVDEIFLSLAFLATEVDIVEVVLNILLALLVDIWPVYKSECLDHDGQTAVEALVPNLHKLPGEGVEDLNRCLAVLAIAEWNEDVLLKLRENSDPFRGFTLKVVIFSAGSVDPASSLQNFEMRPLQIVHLTLGAMENDLLQRLDYFGLVPILVRTISEILASAASSDILLLDRLLDVIFFIFNQQ